MSKASIELMSPKRIERSLKRIAHQIIEKHAGKGMLFVFGVNERGYKLSKIICKLLKKISRLSIQPVKIDVNNGVAPETDLPIKDAFVVIIDDVIFSGKTMEKALQAVNTLGAPRVIKLAVLVDRGHRTVPVEPEFIGLSHPTKLNEEVTVLLPDSDGENRVLLT